MVQLDKKESGKIVNSVEQKEQVGDDILTDMPMANVGFSLAHTMNLGNFSSLKATVSLNMPCLPHDIEETYVTVKAWVDEKLKSVVEEVNNG